MEEPPEARLVMTLRTMDPLLLPPTRGLGVLAAAAAAAVALSCWVAEGALLLLLTLLLPCWVPAVGVPPPAERSRPSDLCPAACNALRPDGAELRCSSCAVGSAAGPIAAAAAGNPLGGIAAAWAACARRS